MSLPLLVIEGLAHKLARHAISIPKSEKGLQRVAFVFLAEYVIAVSRGWLVQAGRDLRDEAIWVARRDIV